MKEITQTIKNQWKNILLYLSGILLLGFGVNIMKASTLGAGSWDTVTINVRSFFNLTLGIPWVTMGMISFSVSAILMIVVVSYRKELKFLFMIIPIILVAIFIDMWNMFVFHDQFADTIWLKLFYYIAGTILLPLGLSLVVKSGFPAFVFDELMLMFVKILKAKQITYIRLVIEFTGIVIGFIFGWIAVYPLDHNFGAVNFGSVLFAFTLSPIMSIYYKLLKVKREDSLTEVK
ncbi:MAG: YitT family protein [Candidatus Izemoplasmatales bacterium]